MTALILDTFVSDHLIARRRELGQDRHDEVWNGVYVMPPMPNIDHQMVVSKLTRICGAVAGRGGVVLPGANVSDLDADWEHNYRVPDVVVTLAGSRAVDRNTHYQGGPDFLVEIRSPGDDTPKKLPFYTALGVRELLVVQRDTRAPTLYRLGRKRLAPVKPTDLDGVPCLVSAVRPLAFRRVDKRAGPRLEVRRTDGKKKTWAV
ncbi:MAG: Uma2 family endonuclease [Gemmataceae bacterium]